MSSLVKYLAPPSLSSASLISGSVERSIIGAEPELAIFFLDQHD